MARQSDDLNETDLFDSHRRDDKRGEQYERPHRRPALVPLAEVITVGREADPEVG